MRELSTTRGVNLCSNDYLGLSTDPHLKEALREGLAYCERMGATGSRLLSGHDAVWDELEAEVRCLPPEQKRLCSSTPASLLILAFSAHCRVLGM